MKLSSLCLTLALSAGAVACSNSSNKCELESAEDKEALGPLADMTKGAYSCKVESGSPSALHAIHPSPATVKDVAGKYRAFLEKNQHEVSEKPYKGKFGNGKKIEGIILSAKNGEKIVTVRIVPFGKNMVETYSYPDAMDFYPLD